MKENSYRKRRWLLLKSNEISIWFLLFFLVVMFFVDRILLRDWIIEICTLIGVMVGIRGWFIQNDNKLDISIDNKKIMTMEKKEKSLNE